jgi:hypothetical protein
MSTNHRSGAIREQLARSEVMSDRGCHDRVDVVEWKIFEKKGYNNITILHLRNISLCPGIPRNLHYWPKYGF